MKLLQDGRCGLFVKRKTTEDESMEVAKFKTPPGPSRVRKKLDKFGL